MHFDWIGGIKMKKIKIAVLSVTLLLFGLTIYTFFCPKVSFTKVIKNSHADTSIEIFGDTFIEQKFNANLSSLTNIYLSFLDVENPFDGNVDMELLKNGKSIFQDNVSYKELEANLLRINLDEVEVKGDDQFVLKISCFNCSKERPLILNTAKEIEKNEMLYFNDKVQSEALLMTLYGNKINYNYSLFAACLFLLFLFVFCLLQIEKKKVEKVVKYFILEFLLSLGFGILVFYNLCDYLYEAQMRGWLFLLLLGISSILIALFIRILKFKDLRMEYLYLNLAIPITLGYALMMIPNYVADEPVHFIRAYNLVDDNILSTDSKVYLPEHFVYYGLGRLKDYSNLRDSVGQAINYGGKRVKVSSAAGYSFPLYFFADIGVLIGKLFSLPVIVTYYLARICNVIASVVLGYFIVKLLPFGKNVALIYLLNPMYLHQAGSVSADAMVNVFCLLFMAVVLNYRKKEQFNKLEMGALFVCIVLLGFAKYIYIPLVLLLVLLIENRKRMPSKVKKGILISTCLAILICGWFLFSMYLLPEATREPVTVGDGISDVNMIGQLKYILTHPIYTIKTILYTFHLMIGDYVDMFFGLRLGWLNINVRSYLIWPYLLALFSAPFIYLKDEKNYFSVKEKWICNIIGVIICFLVILSMWLCWTSIGSMPVQGVQGRYFLPIILLILLTLVNRKQKIVVDNYQYKLTFLLIFTHIGVLVTIIKFFI